MSDNAEDTPDPLIVDISAWVERSKADPIAYLERQATEVLLATIGLTPGYSDKLLLKGGVLMGVVYGSPRQTGDIDLTAAMEPHQGIAEKFAEALDSNFPRAAAELGFPDLLCKVQSIKYFPKGEEFPKFDGPAITLGVGYAKRGSKQEKRFLDGKSPFKLKIDISFKEPVGAIQVIQLNKTSIAIGAYSLFDLLAEKLRAQLQQPDRNRFRHQDIYDLASLITRFALDDAELAQVLDLLLAKSAARGIKPNRESFSNPEIKERAQQGWSSLGLEIGEAPDFDECFDRVEQFYRSLPWAD